MRAKWRSVGWVAIVSLGAFACGKTKARAYCERAQECAGASDPAATCADLERAGVINSADDRCLAQFETWAGCAVEKAECKTQVLTLADDACRTERTKLDQCRGVSGGL